MMPKSWLWDVRRSENEVRRILQNPDHKSFIHYATLLLGRTNKPKEVFSQYLSKENFCLYWNKIKKGLRRDKWKQDRITFWEEIYKFLLKDVKAKGVILRKAKPEPKRGSLSRHVGQAMKALRDLNEMTQKELAVKAGVSQQVISEIESGRANPSLQTIEKIKKHLKGDVDFRIVDMSDFMVEGDVAESGVSNIR